MDETGEALRLEKQFFEVCEELGISGTNQGHLRSFLAPLRNKDAVTHFHYLHCLRVGLLACAIGRFIHHEEKPLLLSGALPDLGKCQTPLHILGRTESWDEADQQTIDAPVLDGYRLLQGRFDVSA